MRHSNSKTFGPSRRALRSCAAFLLAVLVCLSAFPSEAYAAGTGSGQLAGVASGTDVSDAIVDDDAVDGADAYPGESSDTIMPDSGLPAHFYVLARTSAAPAVNNSSQAGTQAVFTPSVGSVSVSGRASGPLEYVIYDIDQAGVSLPEGTILGKTLDDRAYASVSMAAKADMSVIAFPEISFASAGRYEFDIACLDLPDGVLAVDGWKLAVDVSGTPGAWTVSGEYVLDGSDDRIISSAMAEFRLMDVQDSYSYSDEALAAAKDRMSGMTLEEKTGQLFLIHYPKDGAGTVEEAAEFITKYHVGGFLTFVPMYEKSNPDAVREKIAATQALSDVPLLFTVDEEGMFRDENGNAVLDDKGVARGVSRISKYPAFRSSPFLSPSAVKAAGGLDAVRSDAIEKALFLKSLGLNVNHAPCSDIAETGSAYMYLRAWQGDGLETANYVSEFVSATEPNGVGTTLKHFPGYGGTPGNTHDGFVHNDLTESMALHDDLLPFYAGIESGAGSVMVTHNVIEYAEPDGADSTTPASLSGNIYSMLRDDLHYDKIIMTDDLGMEAVKKYVGIPGWDEYQEALEADPDYYVPVENCISLRALKAGADIAMIPTENISADKKTWFFDEMKTVFATAGHPELGGLTEEEIDAKCLRVLAWKAELGILDNASGTDDAEAEYKSPAGDTVRGLLESVWEVAARNAGKGGTVTLLRDCGIESGLTLDGLSVPGASLTLDLAGHDIAYTGEGACILINGGAVLDIAGGPDSIVPEALAAVPDDYAWSDNTLTYAGLSGGETVGRRVDFNNLNLGSIVRTASGVDSISDLIFVDGGKLVIKNAILSNPRGRSAVGSTNASTLAFYGSAILDTGVSGTGDYGGGVYAIDSSISAENSYFVGNSSPANGGGVCAVNSAGNFKNCVFAFNTARKNSGGGVSCVFGSGSGRKLAIDGCDFVANVGKESGGGVFGKTGGWGDSVVIRNSLFDGNTAGIHGGGVMTMLSLDCTLEDDVFLNNHADWHGGAIAREGSVDYKLVATRCRVEGNTAAHSGGGAWVSGGSICRFTDTPFTGNTAKESGGGLHLAVTPGANRTTVFLNCDISGNSAGTNGGGICVANMGIVKIQDKSDITSNTAGSYGGGIYCVASADGNSNVGLTLSNIDIKDNSAGLSGGGGYFGSPSVTYPSLSMSDVAVQGNTANESRLSDGGTGGMYANCNSFQVSGFVRVDGNNAPETAARLTNDLQLAENRMLFVSGDLDKTSLIRINTVSGAEIITVVDASAHDVPDAESIFVPERAGYRTVTDGASIIFTSVGEDSVQAVILVDGVARNVGRVPGLHMDNKTGSYYLLASDVADMLAAYGFDLDGYSGQAVFGFMSEDGGTISVLSDRFTASGSDWIIPAPADESLRGTVVYLPNGLSKGDYDLDSAIGSNGFWSVVVNDVLGTIRDDIEDESFVDYIASGRDYVFDLPDRGGDGEWVIDEPAVSEAVIEKSVSNGVLTVGIKSIGMPVSITSGRSMGSTYTAQYYANMASFKDGAVDANTLLSVIDTRGGNPPQNGKPDDTPVMNLRLDADGHVIKVSTLREVYSSSRFAYSLAPQLMYADRLYMDGSYALSELWVLKEGCLPSSTVRDDWDIYDNSSVPSGDVYDLKFTNVPDNNQSSQAVYLRDGAVIRFVYEPKGGFEDADVTFWDYDITDGKIYSDAACTNAITISQEEHEAKGGTSYAKVGKQGINSVGNYASGATAHLAFGNGVFSGWLTDEILDGGRKYYLNQANRDGKWNAPIPRSYGSCCYNLAKGRDSVTGDLTYIDGLSAQALFDDSPVTGKTLIDGFSLSFARSGNTYTLDAVKDETSDFVTSGLQSFMHPRDDLPNIWTNNFWPMDASPTYGATGHDLKFGNHSKATKRQYFTGSANGNFTDSDDWTDHNSYFGMNFTIDFSIPEGYMGDLEYLFFGDDDMWVFLRELDSDGNPVGADRLVLDIGGIHSSVGEYVDLWDYIEKGDTSDYQLEIFYTERGASGSTCWMQFTLPDARFERVDTDDTGSVSIAKEVVNPEYTTDTAYPFGVSFCDFDGSPFVSDVKGVVLSADGTQKREVRIAKGTGRLMLSAGDRIVFDSLPIGTTWSFYEDALYNCRTEWNVPDGVDSNGLAVSGFVLDASNDILVTCVNEFLPGAELPKTGGMGTGLYVLSGCAIAIIAAAFMLRRRRRA